METSNYSISVQKNGRPVYIVFKEYPANRNVHEEYHWSSICTRHTKFEKWGDKYILIADPWYADLETKIYYSDDPNLSYFKDADDCPRAFLNEEDAYEMIIKLQTQHINKVTYRSKRNLEYYVNKLQRHRKKGNILNRELKDCYSKTGEPITRKELYKQK